MSSSVRQAVIILAVVVLPRSVQFYRHAFGWAMDVETPVYVEFVVPGTLRA